jgi:uncharacterized protein (DUF736 family)
MSVIGTFKTAGDNGYTGDITTLALHASNVRITPVDTRSSDAAPSHRVLAGSVEIGAGWRKTSNEGRDYLALKLDDPSFVAPIYANLFADENGDTHSLIWSRPQRRD